MNRTFKAIQGRIRRIRQGFVFRGEKRGVRWSVEDDALLLEKHQQGLSLLSIASCFPGRHLESVRDHLQDMTSGVYDQRRKAQGLNQRWTEVTDVLIQRVIDLRLEEAKSLAEVALDLNCTPILVRYLWYKRRLPLLSQEARDTVHKRIHWTPEEMKHLTELHNRGTMKPRDIALHFPSKSHIAVRSKLQREKY